MVPKNLTYAYSRFSLMVLSLRNGLFLLKATPPNNPNGSTVTKD